MWIGTSEGLNVYNPMTNTFAAYFYDPGNSQSISNDSITSFCEDDNGNLWIGTRLGLNKLDIESGEFHSYRNDVDNLESIRSDRIVSLYQDSQGILWIGTANGLEKLNFEKQAFKYYTGVLDNNNIISISNFNEDIIWLEIWGGAIEFDMVNHAVISKYNGIFKDQNFYSTMLITFYVGKDGCLWLGTGYSGILKYDPVTAQVTNYRNEPGSDNSLLSDSITTIYFSSDGILWIGTVEGLCSFDPVTEKFTNYKENEAYPDAVKNESIRVVYEDSNNNLWFGVNSGVYMLDKETGEFVCIMDSSEFVQESSDKSVHVIYEDTRGQYWFGTGCGLYRYDPVTKEIIQYGTKNLLLYYTILGILEDNNGDMWITTRHGLGRLSFENNIYTEYGIKDGLQDNFYAVGASYKAEDGELFFGCGGGLISFYPDDIVEDTIAPSVVINGFNLIEKQYVFNEPIEDINEINLSYSNNSFEIDFVALSYKSPEYNQYAYMLENFDEDWNYCNASESFTKYTNIPSGEYTFKVRASNSDGIWNNEGASLKIIIATPFWKEWWFISVLVIIVILAILIFIKFRTQSLVRHAEELKLQVDERTNKLVVKSTQLENELENRIQFTRAIVHELKTPLTAMMGSSELLIDQSRGELEVKLAKNINRGASNLKRRIDELLDIAKGEMGTLGIECKPINAIFIVNEVVDDLTLEVVKKEQNVILNLPDSIPYIYADSDRLRQILFNLIGNAIKYNSAKGTIKITVKQEENSVVFEIADQGIGISPEEQKGLFNLYYRGESANERLGGMGIGLALSKTLIELHRGKIWVNSQKGKGSTFSFSIPIMSLEDSLKEVNRNDKRNK